MSKTEVWLCAGTRLPWRVASWHLSYGEWADEADARAFLALLLAGNHGFVDRAQPVDEAAPLTVVMEMGVDAKHIPSSEEIGDTTAERARDLLLEGAREAYTGLRFQPEQDWTRDADGWEER